MKKFYSRFVLGLIVFSACSPNLANGQTASTEPDEVSYVNLAQGGEITASASLDARPPQNAFDGDPNTNWEAGADAPQWVMIDLQNYATIIRFRLTVSQSQSGETLHRVFAGDSPLNLGLIHEFIGNTADNQALDFSLDVPLTGVRYVKVVTVRSPSPVAWREIEVWGKSGVASVAVTDTPFGSVAVTAPATPVASVADAIYYNGQILTMESDQPAAQAIALKGNKILAVGSDDEVMAFRGDETKVIDLNGLTMTPGFIDSHTHRLGDRNLYGANTTVEEAFRKTLQQGWTSIHELFVFDARMNELIALDQQNKLPMRVSAYLAVGFDYNYNPWYKGAGYKPLQQFSPYLQIAGIKITLDREWGEQVFFDQAQLNAMVADATSSGWQVAVHSFSPKANEELLNAYELALNGASNDKLRLRFEHTGVMTDAQVEKMARLGVIGSVQLINASLWSDDVSFKKYIPASEVRHSARWRDMLNAGIFLIGNTDDPWCCTAWRGDYHPPYDPSVALAIYQGVTRNNFAGRTLEPWQVAQVVTVEEALRMMTINGAYAAHQENVIGSLKPGKYADLVILSGNPLEMPIDQIPTIKVVMTMVGGGVKYCVEGYESVCAPASYP